MALSAKKVGDPVEGLTDGKTYAVVGFTGSTVLVLNDNKKLVHVPYAAFNDSDQWSIVDDDAEKPAPKLLPPPGGLSAGTGVADNQSSSSTQSGSQS